MKNIKLRVFLIIIIMAAVGVYLFLQEQKIKEVKIGFLLPLSGQLADYGTEARDGAMMAINEFNAKQDKIRIIPVVKDQEGSIEKTKAFLLEMADDKEVIGIIGPLASSNVLSVGPIVQEKEIILITPSGTHPGISSIGDYIFRTCPSDARQGENLARFAIEDLKTENIAILYQQDEEYSKRLAEIFKEEARKIGGKIAAEEFYFGEDTNFTGQLGLIKEKEPELIFVPGYIKQGSLIAQQMEKLDMRNIQFLGGDKIGSAVDFIAKGGESVEGAIASAFFYAGSSDEKAKKFVEKFREYYGKDPGWLAALNYDAAGLLIGAISNIKEINRKNVKEALYDTKDYAGAAGGLIFDENGYPINKKILKLKVQGGRWTIFKEE